MNARCAAAWFSAWIRLVFQLGVDQAVLMRLKCLRGTVGAYLVNEDGGGDCVQAREGI